MPDLSLKESIYETTLSIEFVKEVGQTGKISYAKKTFKNIKNDAASEDIYEIAEAIKDVLAKETRYFFINKTTNIQRA
ncbi:DUF1659 domain-containing protein [Clostridium sp. BJN0001]|uniref:DUF1659 domain-containing protein n=1 Tax=Clostridium sp. BJN0001 TaxID=2930219 RepID=UPI001FCF8788|nr:DUF1659 domain-containing protein [Clostridium sp. BJN0001]